MSFYVVDVSKWQSVDQAVQSGAAATIVKATQGNWYVSEKCNAQYAAAKKAGKLLGLYHYAEGGDPVAEANYFIANIKNYVGEAILILDWEKADNAAWGNKGWSLAFAQRVHALTGAWPLIYCQDSSLSQVASCAQYCGLWLAGYPYYPGTEHMYPGWSAPASIPWSISPWKSATMWQYSSTDGALDRSIFYGDAAAWKKIAKPSVKVTTNVPAQKPVSTGYSIAGKSLESLAADVLAGKLGSGSTRTTKLGGYADAVQAIVNERLKAITATQSHNILAAQVKAGKLGNGDTRKKLLGSYYNAVQTLINKAAAPAKISKGSTVTIANPVDEHGTKLLVSGKYTVMSLSGTRAVVGRGGVVTAALNVANLRLV